LACFVLACKNPGGDQQRIAGKKKSYKQACLDE